MGGLGIPDLKAEAEGHWWRQLLCDFTFAQVSCRSHWETVPVNWRRIQLRQIVEAIDESTYTWKTIVGGKFNTNRPKPNYELSGIPADLKVDASTFHRGQRKMDSGTGTNGKLLRSLGLHHHQLLLQESLTR